MDSLKLFEDVCRICLKHGMKLDWNEEIFEFSTVTYKDCYYRYTQLYELDSDCYPRNLCEICANELKNAYMLFEKALESFNILETVGVSKQHDTKFSALDMCSSSPEINYEENVFDGDNDHIDDKTVIEIERQICLSPENEGYAIDETENKIDVCTEIIKDENVISETTHFIDIQDLAPSAEITLEPKYPDILNAELPKSTADKKKFSTRRKCQFVPDTTLDQEIDELYDTTLSKVSTTKRPATKRKRQSVTKVSMKEQVDDCCKTTTKDCNKIQKIKSVESSLESNLSESCETKSPIPATKPKKSRENYRMCAYCSLMFDGPTKLALHEARHKEDRKRTEICPQCGVKFYDKFSLTVHLETHDENRQKKFKCEFCGNAFFNRGSLNVHRRVHLGLMVKCQICPKEYVRQIDLDKHLLTHSASPLQRNVGKNKYTVQCEYCNKSVLTVMLKSHLAVHLGQPQLKCKICDKNFFSRANCTKHLRKVHKKKSSEYEELIHYYVDRIKRMSNLMIKQQFNVQQLTK